MESNVIRGTNCCIKIKLTFLMLGVLDGSLIPDVLVNLMFLLMVKKRRGTVC